MKIVCSNRGRLQTREWGPSIFPSLIDLERYMSSDRKTAQYYSKAVIKGDRGLSIRAYIILYM